jgi:hypothetical protein
MKMLKVRNSHISIDIISACIAMRVEGINVRYADKYAALKQTIMNFEVPYNGKDNDDYVNGQGFCCDDATGLRAGNDNLELYQYYYHSDHLGSK